MLDVNAADAITERYPEIDVWYLGGHLVGEIVNISVDESVLTPDGKADVAKLAPIAFDPVNNACHKLGEKAGNAFSNGLKLK